MRKITRIVFMVVGLSLLTAVFAFLISRPAPAQAPAPVALVRVTNTPLPVQGTVNANVTNTVPVSRNLTVSVLNPPLLPQLGSQTITLSASSLGSPGCPVGSTSPSEQFTFNTYVAKNSGILEPFTLPAGKVLVVTQFDWTASGSAAVANQSRTAYLFPATTLGSSAADAQSTVVTDSTGKAGGSETFPTGIVLQNPAFFCMSLNPPVPGETVSGVINGFLAADQ